MSPGRILFQTYLDADKRLEELRDAAIAARSANAKTDDFKKFMKSAGDDDAA